MEIGKLLASQSFTIFLIVVFLSGASMGFSFGIAQAEKYANDIMISQYGATLQEYVEKCNVRFGDQNIVISDLNAIR